MTWADPRRTAAALSVLALIFASDLVLAQGRRVALVVGNDAYEAQSVLHNAVNDARAVATGLREVGFSVTGVENADRSRLMSALASFAESLASDDVALFYFAGHGVQVDQENYLLPTDYAGQTAANVRLNGLKASDVEEMLQTARVAMLVFDACRNNPYRSVGGRVSGIRGGGRGLARMEPRGTLIAYAAGAGEVAADGAPGSNGLFTSKFLEALREPGLTASELFMHVRREVHFASNESQFPAVYNSLLYPFVFRPTDDPIVDIVDNDVKVDPIVDDELGRQEDRAFWQSAEGMNTVASYLAYEAEFPNGRFVELSRLRRAELEDSDLAASDPRPSRRSAGERFSDCAECPELVVVPAGTFTMGSEVYYDYEGPQHRVTIPSPFAVGVYEVTFAEWDACASAGGCGGYRPNDEGWGRGARPVMNVSWDDAKSYVRWLSSRTGASYRLLSESEWEYVARAGTRTRTWWGDSVGRNRANCFNCGSRWDGEETAPVGSFRSNAFGLHDVSGNVYEWVEDCWHDSYAGAPSDGSAWTSGGDCGLRVVRGGSWNHGQRPLRSASRFGEAAGARYGSVGFRVSRTLD